METINLRRRLFFSAVSCLGATAAALYTRHSLSGAGKDSSDDATATLLSLHSAPPQAAAIARLFDSAPAGILLASYGNFFPKMMSAHEYSQAPAALEAAATKIKSARNAHRLRALPAVAAAHAIPFSEDQEQLCACIKKALDSAVREEREIVLQNLVTASLPSPDVNVRWRVGDDVSNRVGEMISEAEQRPQFVAAASIALTFLLNMRTILSRNGSAADRRRASKVDRIVERALTSKAPHFFYLKEVRKHHETAFKHYSPHIKTSLPSHLTEMVLQSRCARRATPSYNLRLALVHARMTYEVWQTANNLNQRDESVMTEAQAKKAWPKLVQFEAACGMLALLPTFSELKLPTSERPFQRFIKDVLIPELTTYRPEHHPGCRQLRALAAHPRAICDFDPQAVADRVGSHGLHPFIDVALELFALVGVHRAAHKIDLLTETRLETMQQSAKHAFDLPTTHALTPSLLEVIKVKVAETDVDCGASLDKVESGIGPSEITTTTSSEAEPSR